MFYVDSHIHIQDYTSKDVNNVVTEAVNNNILKFVNVSSHPNDWEKVISLANRFPQIIPAIGIHPWYISSAPQNWQNILEEKLKDIPELWVGECGIDRLKNPQTELQEQIFVSQIKLAQKYHRPLIIHSVKADNIMQKYFSLLPKQTIFHSFCGSKEWGEQIQRHGFYIGINFSILRKKNYSSIIQKLDINKILLETDGPYQAILKNSESMPAELPTLSAHIAQAFNITEAEMLNQLYQNWLNFNRR